MHTRHKIITGDCRDISKIPRESVHLIITSPPYWQLKDYGNQTKLALTILMKIILTISTFSGTSALKACTRDAVYV